MEEIRIPCMTYSGHHFSEQYSTKVTKITLDLRDIAVVDLSADVIHSLAGGITSELALIRSVTRSLRANVLPVKQVRFLVDGKARETLAGHISIAQPFR